MPARLRLFVARPGPRGADGLLALAFAVLLQLELWLGETYEGAPAFPGDRAATAPLIAIATVALAWRRARPLPAFAGAMGGIALQSLLTGGSEALGLFLVLLVAVYSAAAYGVWPAYVLAGAAVAVVAHDARSALGWEVWDSVFTGAFVLAGFVFGRIVHRRGAQGRALAERARRLEAAREEDARAAVAEERARIARELHDVVAHAVSVMVIQAQAGQSVLGDAAPPAARDALTKIESTGRDAMVELRRLVGMLREHEHHGLQPQPGLADLPELAASLRRSGLDVELDVGGDAAGRPLPPGVDLAAFRVVQEALTNVLKHAGTGRAAVTVRHDDGGVAVLVEDEGRGVAQDDALPAGGHGLVGMRERVSLYGGELEAGPREGGGFAVRARLPVPVETAALA